MSSISNKIRCELHRVIEARKTLCFDVACTLVCYAHIAITPRPSNTLLTGDTFSFTLLQGPLGLNYLTSHLFVELVLIFVDFIGKVFFCLFDLPAEFLNILGRLSILDDLVWTKR